MTGALRAVLCALALLVGALPAAARPTIPLDGRWEFRFAPDDRGEAEGWFRPEIPFADSIRVPGCWDAQGIGAPTDKLRHNAIGVGWYRRRIALPPDWTRSRVLLVVGGAHRAARVWLNGQEIGSHWGYPVSFRLDLTPALRSSGEQALVIAVDSRPHLDRDPLIGAFDGVDFMDIHWGGLFEHVWLESTANRWIEDIYVQPDPLAHRASVKVEVGGHSPRTAFLSRPDAVPRRLGPPRRSRAGAPEQRSEIGYTVRIWNRAGSGRVLARGSRAVDATGSRLDLDLRLPGAPLWTPETPSLIVLDLTLRNGSKVVDRRSVRFGLRRLEVRGNRFYLNGRPFYLRGYGDDWTFPLDLSAPADAASWRRYLLQRKSFGFNAVRHHSTMPPESYLEAADEAGVFVQPELPIAYEPYFNASTPQGKHLYREVWSGYIRQMRNHPSVFSWCMGNEFYNGLALGPQLYRTAKELDPTRPVIDSDGVPSSADRPTLDYLSVQFDEGAIPWGGQIDKYRPAEPPKKPLVVHEMSNISVLPNPADIARYVGVVRPVWLEAMAERVKAQGLQARLPAMLAASRRLQASLLKLNIEGARLSTEISGHYQWLFRDYWHQSTGFVDQFDAGRAITPRFARQFVADAVLLWDHDRVSFRSGESIPLRMFVSDYRLDDAPPPVAIRVTLGGASLLLRRASAGPTRGLLGPWIGTLTTPLVKTPRHMMLAADAGPVHNAWSVWVFPSRTPTVSPAGPTDSPHTLGERPWTEADGPIIVRSLTPSTLQKLESGASVFLTGDEATFPALQARFKPAWWHGDDTSDHCYGNMLEAHASVEGFPAAGYGDLQMSGMMADRPVVLLDEVPGHVEPIIWCLDVPWRMRRKAYLFEAKVGAGKLLVSTLNMSRAQRDRDPAADWLYRRLVQYAGSPGFQPRAEIPVGWLRPRVGNEILPSDSSWVEGYGKVLEFTEAPGRWYSIREDQAVLYVVRQTDGKQRLRWLTAVVPKSVTGSRITFVWAGGIGYRSEPGGGRFTLALNGEPLLDFTFAETSAKWRSADGSAELRYVVRRRLDQDTVGLFYLTVAADRVRKGTPAELTVTATAQSSRRWFALNPYPDTAREE